MEYVAKLGDSLWSIAARYGMTLGDMQAANNNLAHRLPPWGVNTGDKIVVPITSAKDPPLSPVAGPRYVKAKNLRVADIIISTTKAVESEKIREFTNSKASHSAIYVGTLPDIGDWQVIEATGSGVSHVTLSTALLEDSLAVVYRVRHLSQTVADKVRDFAMKQLGKPYDMGSVFRMFSCKATHVNEYESCVNDGILTQKPHAAEEQFMCSELVFAAFREAGRPLSSRLPEASTPQSIIELNGKLDYVGHLRPLPW